MFFPFKELVQHLKRYIMKDLYTRITQGQMDGYIPRNRLMHPNLNNLSYTATISVNDTQPKKITNFENSVYESLFEVEKNLLNQRMALLVLIVDPIPSICNRLK